MNESRGLKQPPAKRGWLSVVVLIATLYVVGSPPLFYIALRTGMVGISQEGDEANAVENCIAPARWLYEDSPFQPVLQPWAEFWYDTLLT